MRRVILLASSFCFFFGLTIVTDWKTALIAVGTFTAGLLLGADNAP